jgi:hypothetical protein
MSGARPRAGAGRSMLAADDPGIAPQTARQRAGQIVACARHLADLVAHHPRGCGEEAITVDCSSPLSGLVLAHCASARPLP